MKKTRRFQILMLTLIAAVMIFGQTLSVFAAAPTIKKVEYEGKGEVDVDFTKRVNFKNPKVTVTDNKGNTYTAAITDKDKNGIELRIKKFKKGRTYTFKISGVRVRGTSKYGTITGTVEIPKETTTITRTKAISIAEEHAKTTLKATKIRYKEAEKDTWRGKAVWDVEFEGKINGLWNEFEYKVSRSTGEILYSTYEIDD